MKRRTFQTTLLDCSFTPSKKPNCVQMQEDENLVEDSKNQKFLFSPRSCHLAHDVHRLVNTEGKNDSRLSTLNWKHVVSENLDLKYVVLFSKQDADMLLRRLEQEVEYFSDDLLKVKIFGKWLQIPRKQVSYGDSGLTYSFSGNCIPALPWIPLIQELKEVVQKACGEEFNFVLVNRYKDGDDHIGEHRDDESDLVKEAPIASLSFGQQRDFIFRHKNARGPKASRLVNPVKLKLEHGSILLMNFPTNRFWYHSLPIRKKARNVRVNLTFRRMVLKQ